MESIFTKIINREIKSEIIDENDKVIVIKDINPQAPIHFLIIPKKFFINIIEMGDYDKEYGMHIFEMAKKLSNNIIGTKDFKLIINNGKLAGQCVFHMHAHFLAGF